MKKALLVALLLLPSTLAAQGMIKVASVDGPVEYKARTVAAFDPLSSSTAFIDVGDTVRTGLGATLTLELPGGAFMIIYENSMLTMQELRAPTVRNLIRAVIDKVRFYIQRFGGKSNPNDVGMPTAVMAVRA